ncbi:MAG: FAD-linked oxidase C-terminal domain-containing protein [Acidobacteriota bacterium]
MNHEPSQLAAELKKLARGEVYGDIIHRVAFSTDASSYRILPQCVVAPRDTRDIVAVVRYAAEHRIPVAPRGAGSGVAGESLCSGIVFDMTRHMNRILEVTDESVVCEPGAVLDDVNKRLAKLRRKIGPDPSSANRATIGGVTGNNATGAHSLQYGHIARYLESVEAILADGTVVELTNGMSAGNGPGDRAGALAGECWRLLSASRATIEKALPKTRRNRSGYNIAGVCRAGTVDMARLLAGSEGTLAIFTRLTVRTVPLPAMKGLLQLEFDSLEKAARAVPAIVETGPAACEMMDESLITLAVDQLPQYRDILPAGAAALLLIEHVGASQDEVREKIAKTDRAAAGMATRRTIITDLQAQARVWKSRKDAGPLLYRNRSRKHPAEFMEDVSVDHTHLADYITGLQQILRKYDTRVSFFGHAGDGELHLRPYLDLGDPKDREKMLAIAEDVFSLAWSLGGSISGEHADGLVRAAFVRRQYGDHYYDILKRIKRIFDPAGLMNPGKILNEDPNVMFTSLRRAHRVLPERTRSEMLFRPGELELELEQCYGCGLCLGREPVLRMCPVFRATAGELGSSRAKANLLHYWATGQLSEDDFESSEFRRFLDLCVNCKMCERECPSGVRISTLMAAARAEYARRKGFRRAEAVLSRNRYLSSAGSALSGLANLGMNLPGSGVLVERLFGLDRRRKLPRFARGSFLRAGRNYLTACAPLHDPVAKVAYFIDAYANYHDLELGFAVVNVLRHNGVEVVLPEQRPAPLPAIVYGDVRTARTDLSYSTSHLAEAVRQGCKIVCSEPSAALCLREELRHYVEGDAASLVAENTIELMSFLQDLRRLGKLKAPLSPVSGRFAYHLPCHLRATGDETVTVRLLREHFGAEVTDLQAGCCGLSGTFGLQKKNYELASRISESLAGALRAAAAPVALTECAACKMQIEHIAEMGAIHPIKLLAQAYGLR